MDKSRNHSSRGYTPARTTTLVDNQFYQLGIWDARVNYRQGSLTLRVVNEVPTFFESIQEDNSGHTPEVSPTWWTIWASGGVVPPPIPGPQGTFGLWNNAINYVLGQMVYYNGFLYTALQPNTNIIPGTDPIIWQLLPWTVEHNFLGEWNLAYPYVAGQAVWYNGTIYRALTNSTGAAPDISPLNWEDIFAVTATTEARDAFSYNGTNNYVLSGIPIYPLMSKAFLNSYHMIYGIEYIIAGNVLTIIPVGLGFTPIIGETIIIFWN